MANLAQSFAPHLTPFVVVFPLSQTKFDAYARPGWCFLPSGLFSFPPFDVSRPVSFFELHVAAGAASSASPLLILSPLFFLTILRRRLGFVFPPRKRKDPIFFSLLLSRRSERELFSKSIFPFFFSCARGSRPREQVYRRQLFLFSPFSFCLFLFLPTPFPFFSLPGDNRSGKGQRSRVDAPIGVSGSPLDVLEAGKPHLFFAAWPPDLAV